MELDDDIYNKITELSEEGNKLFDYCEFDEAIEKFKEALDLVPEPKTIWEASLWLYTAIGDSYFMDDEYEKALDAMYDAYNCTDATENPFVNLRLGQCLFELEQMDKAEEFLLRAYMLDGTEIFKGEGKKYLAYMKKKYNL